MNAYAGSDSLGRSLPVGGNCQDGWPALELSEVRFVSIKKQTRSSLMQGLVKAHAALGTGRFPGAPFKDQSAADLDSKARYYLSRQGDLLVTYPEIDDSGLDFAVALNGDIGRIPIQMTLRGRLDIGNSQIGIRVKLLSPFETLEYAWKFVLEGLSPQGAQGYAADGVRVEPVGMTQATADEPEKWILKCGGESILDALRECLPSLSGGPASYVRCLADKLAEDAAEIALRIGLIRMRIQKSKIGGNFFV